MVNILIQYGTDKGNQKVARQLFLLLSGCVSPETNRIELNHRAMNILDICAYANIEMKDIRRAISILMNDNIIMRVIGKGKDFFYMNPQYMKDPDTPDCLLDWLTDFFQEERNDENKELVYFSKGKRRISIDIGSDIRKLID